MIENNDISLEELHSFMYNGDNLSPEFIIYSEKISNRLKYVCRFIFNQGLNKRFILTDDFTEFTNSKLFQINYSTKHLEGAFTIIPSELVFESDIKEFIPPVNSEHRLVLFYPKKDGDFEMDLFAGVFYFISRYEEWQKFTKDKHGRFEILNSILYKLSIIKRPLVDIWLHEFKIQLQQKFNTLNFIQRNFQFVSTIDVDNLYAYKAKPILRNLGGGLKDLLGLNINLVWSRIATVLFRKKDPFDAYDFQIQLSKSYKIPLIYFFLFRNKTTFDRTVNPSSKSFIKLFLKIKKSNVKFGLHPSYYTSTNPELLSHELKLMSDKSKTVINLSRQHYLKFDIKSTPNQLEENGILFDFTMGFASGLGFRAGTTLPFYYYDFKNESEMKLMAIPFVAMDGAFYNYNNMDLARVKDELVSLGNQIRDLQGLFVTVFHDRSFSKYHYPGWKDVYIDLHKTFSSSTQ